MAVNMEPTPISSFFGGRDRSDANEARTVVVKKRAQPREDDQVEPEPEEDDTGSETRKADAPEPEPEEEGEHETSQAEQGGDDDSDESDDIDLDQTTDPEALRAAAKRAAAKAKKLELSRRRSQSEAGKREQKLRDEMKSDMEKLQNQLQAFMQGANRDSSTAVTAEDETPELTGEDGDFLTVGQVKKLQNKQKQQKAQEQSQRALAKRWLDAEGAELQSLPGAKDYMDFASKELESDGKLAKLQFSAGKVLYVMSKKHEKDMAAAKDAEYKRGLKDGERKLRKEAEQLGRLPPTAAQRSSVQARNKQQGEDASKDSNRLVRLFANTGQKYGLPPIRMKPKGA